MTGAGDALVGRDALLEALRARADEMLGGRGGLVLITGEPGIGKTRTAQEIVEHARRSGARAATGRCHPDPGAPPYWPWIQVLRTLAREEGPASIRRRLGRDTASVLEILPELREHGAPVVPPPALDASAARFRLLDAVARLCLGAAADRPLVLLLDDLQWADAGSLLVLDLLVPALRDVPLLLLATCRSPEEGPGGAADRTIGRLSRHGDVVPLSGVERADVARLAELVAGCPVADEAVDALHRRTAGNPLFVRELLRLLAGAHDLGSLRGSEVTRVPLPSSIRHVLGERVQHLGSRTRLALEIAALVGKEFDVETVRAVASSGVTDALRAAEVLRALDEAALAGLIAPRGDVTGAYAFAHDLVRETLEESVDAPRRALLHGAIGQALDEAGAAVEDVAEQFVKAAGAGFAREAVQWTTRAGDRALAQWAYDAAVTSFARALAALDLTRESDRDLQRCDLLLALGDALARSGDAARATSVLREAANLARATGSTHRLARAALLQPQGRGEFTTSAQLFDRETAALLEEARHALAGEESALRARVLAALSASPGRAPLASEAVVLARRVGDAATLGYALHRFLLTLGPLRAPERLALSEEILALAARANDKLLEFEGRTEHLMALLEHGDRAAIDEAVAHHGRLVAELRQPGPLWTNAAVRALQAFLDGALDEAERRAGEALAIGQESQPESATQAFAGQLALIRAEQGRLDELVPAVEGLAAQQPDVPAWRCALAYMYAETGRHREALGELDRLATAGFADLPEDGLLQMALANLAEACVALDAARYADALYERLRPLTGRHLVVGGALCLGSADRYLAGLAALAGRIEDACAHFESALRAQLRLRAIPWLAHTRLEYARLLQRIAGADDRVATLLAEVRLVARAHDLTRVARRLGELAGAVPPAPQDAAARPLAAARLAREGEYWSVAWEGREWRLRAVKGFHYLAYLLAHPGRDVHVLDLLALTEGSPPVPRRAGDGIAVLDDRARREYRRRLTDLRAAAEEAERQSDLARAAHLADEIAGLQAALETAYGTALSTPGARDPRSTGERARKSVTNRLRTVIDRMAEVDADLGRHLAIAVRTGSVCVYRPERDPGWTVVL